MPPTPPPANITISGIATFDRVPLNTTNGSGLNYNATRQDPIRGAIVELVNNSGTILESATTTATGAYSFTVATGTSVRVRVKAQLLHTGGSSDIDLSVVDNTNSNTLYALQGSLAAASTTTATRNLNAGSGWGGTSYTGARSAAPFALLDTLYDATQAFVAVDANIDFPTLNIFWSPQNRSASGDVTQGEIGTSSFTRIGGVPTILILGDADADTDEYDESVITHEFGHYFERAFSRAGSIGGSHSLNNRLDMRVAFSEGFGNALAGFIDNPRYRDSFGNDQSSDFGFELEANTYAQPGWYSEGSIQSVLYDIMDANSDGADVVSGGLGPVYRTLISTDYANTNTATSIFTFDTALKTEGSLQAASLDALLTAQNIIGRGADGAGETNDGNIPSALPVYKTLSIGGAAVEVCSVDDAGEYNKLGNRAFLTLNVPATQSVTLTADAVDGAGTSDPDIYIYQRDTRIATAISPVNNTETHSRNYGAGDYIIVVFDDANASVDGTGIDKCFNVQAQ
ncbi:hypothetical protein GCM10009069_09920 [Algimonas arctica]|uniref:Uncharacterized protein n=1 Tax=Algimonas arctica TaxID=1479486 RepID=A0A8J3CNZ2_9PROT|nr:hypothetical protein GCM10009069_09920 [Algimonas arctica]